MGKLKMKYIAILYFFTIYTSTAFSQVDVIRRVPCENTVYTLQYYYIKNHDSLFQRNSIILNRLTDSLNKYFKPMCIQFQVCKIDTIFDYNYYKLTDFPDNNTNEIYDVKQLHYNPYAINVYWNGDYIDANYKGICIDRKEKPAIFITYGAAGSSDVLGYCTLMFRYFGLKPTQSYTGSLEFVNKSNGEITADSVWDTPADPFGLYFFPSTDTFLHPASIPGLGYMYTNRKDPNGEYYNPMIYNPMSYYNISTKKPIITNEQKLRIIANERRCRRIYWGLKE